MNERYTAIKAQGFTIDVRGPYPVLIRGQVGKAYPSFTDALEAAEQVIGA